MFYQIMNKDRILGIFDWSSAMPKLVQDNGLPAFISKSVSAWLNTRTPAKNRAHMQELMTSCGLTTPQDVIDYAKGLSLSDTLWVQKEGEGLAWKDISLFQNEFSEVLAHTAFTGELQDSRLPTPSPEFSTNGRLPKCWHREGSTIMLYKGGTEHFANAGMEPYCEVMASQMLDVLGYPHVTYALDHFKGHRICKCELFTDESTMLLPIYRYFPFDTFEALLSQCRQSGLGEDLAHILLTDYLICNPDRHANNFGVLLDADTFELKGMAPIYDNDLSLFCYLTSRDTMEGYPSIATPSLYPTYEIGVELAIDIIGNKDNVAGLINFKFDRSKLESLNDGWITNVEKWLQSRVKTLLDM